MKSFTHVVFASSTTDGDNTLDACDSLLYEDPFDARHQVLQRNSFLGVDWKRFEFRLVARHYGGQRDIASMRGHHLWDNVILEIASIILAMV